MIVPRYMQTREASDYAGFGKKDPRSDAFKNFAEANKLLAKITPAGKAIWDTREIDKVMKRGRKPVTKRGRKPVVTKRIRKPVGVKGG